jgi:putative transposase
MNKIDEIYTEMPYYGYRRMTAELQRTGNQINHKRVLSLMHQMGIEAIYPHKNLSKNETEHPRFPYLLKDLIVDHPNHVWGTDITYIRMSQGFIYLVAFMDWYSRYVLSWKLSTTLDTAFVLEAASEALSIATPDIENTDQGVQFTSQDYLNIWDPAKTQRSMDGKGRYSDNIFTERLWRSVKYEEVYLKNYSSVLDARDGINNYLNTYNYRRLHQSLGYKTPAEIYYGERRNGS